MPLKRDNTSLYNHFHTNAFSRILPHTLAITATPQASRQPLRARYQHFARMTRISVIIYASFAEDACHFQSRAKHIQPYGSAPDISPATAAGWLHFRHFRHSLFILILLFSQAMPLHKYIILPKE